MFKNVLFLYVNKQYRHISDIYSCTPYSTYCNLSHSKIHRYKHTVKPMYIHTVQFGYAYICMYYRYSIYACTVGTTYDYVFVCKYFI